MDSWVFNKIAGAMLAALLVAFGAGTLADIFHGSHGDGKQAKRSSLPKGWKPG